MRETLRAESLSSLRYATSGPRAEKSSYSQLHKRGQLTKNPLEERLVAAEDDP